MTSPQRRPAGDDQEPRQHEEGVQGEAGRVQRPGQRIEVASRRIGIAQDGHAVGVVEDDADHGEPAHAVERRPAGRHAKVRGEDTRRGHGRRVPTLVAILTLLVGIGASVVTVTATDAAAVTASTRRTCRAPEGLVRRHLVVGGRSRSYLVAAPPGGSSPAPILLAFHGYSSSATTLARNSSLHVAAGSAGYVTVYPDGTGRPSRWALPGRLAGADDGAFVDALLADVARRACGDATRVSAAGFSNGAAFVGQLACRRPGSFRALAFVGGAGLVEPCASARTPASTSVVIVHGDADAVVKTGGGPVLGGALQAEPLRLATTRWRMVPARAVRLVLVPGAGHVWPSVATKEIVATFAA